MSNRTILPPSSSRARRSSRDIKITSNPIGIGAHHVDEGPQAPETAPEGTPTVAPPARKERRDTLPYRRATLRSSSPTSYSIINR